MITKVDEGIFRGPQPVLLRDWQALKDAGIKYALDLETGSHVFCDGSPLKEQTLSDIYGIRTYCHPLGEILPPTPYELDSALYLIYTKKPIYIHCKAGVDRTGMVVAYYRMISSRWSKSAAVQEMKAMGMHWWYFWWSMFL